MSDVPAQGYDKAPARRVLEAALRFGGVTYRELAQELALSPSRLSHKIGPRYPFDRLTIEEIDGVVAFLDLKPAQREVLLRSFGHDRRAPAVPTEPAEPEETPTAVVEHAPLARPRGNLPLSLSSFVGRERERATAADLLESARLVTLTGTGGAGKTRLALEVARELAERYLDGAWLVELAPLADPALLPQAVATALVVQPAAGAELAAALISHLAGRTLLLLLDNCEHLLEASAALTQQLLQACPGLTVLATSRERLGIAGESVLALPALSLPPARPAEGPDAVEALLAAESGRLFLERAHAVRAGLQVTPAGATAVAEICRRLDGLPLALELAAAWAAAMPVEQIAVRLQGERLLSARGSRIAEPRQQTLRGALDWSHNLLPAEEQLLFRRLAVFAGGWTLDAATEVAGDADVDPLFVLLSLESRSMVVMEEDGGEARYRFLNPVHEYARERLAAAGEADVLAVRHRDWSLDLAERAANELGGTTQLAWLRQLDREYDNLRTALAWSLEQGDGEAALRLACALGPYWGRRAQLTGEGRDWLTRAITATGGTLRSRALAQRWAGWLAFRQSEFGPADELLTSALATLEEQDDRRGQALAEWNLGQVAWRQVRFDDAHRHLDASLALFESAGDRTAAAEPLRVLAAIATDEGRNEEALALYEQALALFREAGDDTSVTVVLNNLGNVANRMENFERATAFIEEGLALARMVDDRRSEAYAVNYLAAIARNREQYPVAVARHQEALALFHELGMRLEMTTVLASLAEITRVQGDVPACARLMGASDAVREAIGAPLPPALRGSWEEVAQEAIAAIGETAFAAAYDLGRAMSVEQVVAFVRSIEAQEARSS